MSTFSAHSLAQLIKALDLLTRSQGATIQELMDELEISRRSVYRVFDLLDQLQIHREDDQFFQENVKRYFVEPQQLQKLGLTIPPIPDLTLTLPEVLILQYLFQSGGVFKNTSTEGVMMTLRKKLAFLGESQGLNISGAGMDSVFQVTAKTSKDYSGKEELIADLTQAIIQTRGCTVTYHNFKTDEIKTYDIHPLKIVEHKGGLYAFVRVVKYGSITTLAVERIQNLTINESTFPYPENFDPDKMLESAFELTFGTPEIVKIHFNPKEAKYIQERTWSADQEIEIQENKSIILTMTTSGLEDVKRWVLQYGSGAKVLEPQSLKQAVEEEARGILA